MSTLDAKIAGLGFFSLLYPEWHLILFILKAGLDYIYRCYCFKERYHPLWKRYFLGVNGNFIFFFLLDAYYLQQERIFRKIYNILSERKR